jgi:hypothetical protein
LGIGYNGRVDDCDDGDDAAQIKGMVEGRRNSARSTSMSWRIEVVVLILRIDFYVNNLGLIKWI